MGSKGNIISDKRSRPTENLGKHITELYNRFHQPENLVVEPEEQ